MTAVSPEIPTGRSIKIGLSTMARISSASVVVLASPTSLNSLSPVRTILMTGRSSFSRTSRNSSSVGVSSRYLRMLRTAPFSSNNANPMRDLEQRGLCQYSIKANPFFLFQPHTPRFQSRHVPTTYPGRSQFLQLVKFRRIPSQCRTAQPTRPHIFCHRLVVQC